MPIYLGMDREQDIPFVYENGELRFENPLTLPEGTRGFIHVTSDTSAHNSLGFDPREFWKNKSIADLMAEQNVRPGARLSDLRGDWPPEDSIDEFLAEVRKGRR